MTLDEAIKHTEFVANKNTTNCFCAEEHRQLAEWLKDYKRLLEQTQWIPVSEILPETNMACLVSVGKLYLREIAIYSDLMGTTDHKIFYQGDYGHGNFENITEYVKAWKPLPKPHREEGE